MSYRGKVLIAVAAVDAVVWLCIIAKAKALLG